MNKTLKRKIGLICATFLLIMTMAVPAFAANNDIGYSYKIKAYHGNSYSYDRYRQTTNIKNPWKVNMTYSSEGAGTVTTYWLTRTEGFAPASNTHNVKAGSGAHYYNATNIASKKRVCLGAENNNNTSKTYQVSGYWDEETN